MTKKISKRIEQGVDRDTMHDMSSDILTDAIYSFTTDLLRELYADDNIQDLDRAIASVNAVTRKVALDGIKLRKANIVRRTNARKQSIDDTPTIAKKDIKWKKYRKNKKLEYTTDVDVNGKYMLKKRKEDTVVGLLTKEQLDDESEDDGEYKMTSKEKEKVFTMGYIPSV
jgi:hypothetical protein